MGRFFHLFIIVGAMLTHSVLAETSVYTTESDSQSNDSSVLLQSQYPKAKTIFLTYEDAPKSAYVGELLPVKLKAIIAEETFENISTEFNGSENLEVINPEAKWQWFSDNIFYNTFYFKALTQEAKLPNIKLNIEKSGAIIDSETIQAHTPNIVKLKGTKIFSQVIAESLEVKKHKTSKFDDSNYIIVLEIEGKYSNLSDFSLEWVKRDGIDSSLENMPFYKIFYYAIIPDYTQKFDFTYFNSQKNEFIKISLPVILSADEVSTQIGLNPGESSLQPYKYITFGTIFVTLLLIYIKRRRVGYIILMAMLVALFIYDKNPLNSIRIQEQTKVRILPTEKSTIFHTIERSTYAQKLGQRGDFVKILLSNGKIGWIKEEYVFED